MFSVFIQLFKNSEAGLLEILLETIDYKYEIET